MRRAMMKTVLLVLSLVFLVPTFSYPVGGDDKKPYYKDCENCLNCREDNRCFSCKKGYMVKKIYSRRYCGSQCPRNEKVWDPVLRSDICDEKQDCGSFSEPHCVECLLSGSCVKCEENFALKLRDNITLHNMCDRSCSVRCMVKGTLVCETATAQCPPGEASSTVQLTTPSSAVVSGRTKTTVDSSQTNPNPEPTADGTPTDYNGYTETEDESWDDDY